MSLYLFALVDQLPSGKPGSGLTGPLSVRRVGQAFAVVERRADVPPPEFGTLQRHQAVVADLASRVPAILPVRFGSLMDEDALEEALSEREGDVEEAFATVRGRVQFTWRRSGGRTPSKGAQGSPRSKKAGLSGTEFLRAAARRSRPTPPPAWRVVRARLAALTAAERYQPVSATLPESLYHLVPRAAVKRYESSARALRESNRSLTLTGPWPPFAFAPDIL